MKYSKGGLIATATVAFCTLMIFIAIYKRSHIPFAYETEAINQYLPALVWLGGTIMLLIRSFFPPLSWLRGLLTFFGGTFVALLILHLLFKGNFLADLIMAFLFLYFGFKKPKHYKKKLRKEKRELEEHEEIRKDDIK